MNESYLGYYNRYSSKAMLVFAWHALKARTRLARLSLLNRQKDYVRLASNPDLLALHRKINGYLLEATTEWKNYDYGEGYFYQSFDLVGITGFRDTASRIESMGLKGIVADKRVLDIGCNSGFLSLSIADVAKEVVGMEINPYAVSIGKAAMGYLGISNVNLFSAPFEKWDSLEQFDVVMSFANHSTYDHLTSHTVEAYFDKCRALLKPDGVFLFESHAPDYEGDSLIDVLDVMRAKFDVEEPRILDKGTFLDKGRTFVRAKHRVQDE